MYKNITCFNRYRSIKKFENALLKSSNLNNFVKTKDNKNEIVYLNPDVLISINKKTVNFLVFDYTNIQVIEKINQFSETLF